MVRPIPIFHIDNNPFVYLSSKDELDLTSDKYVNFFSEDHQAFFIHAATQTMVTVNSQKIEKQDLLLIEPNSNVSNDDLVLCVFGMHRGILQGCNLDCNLGVCLRYFNKKENHVYLYSLDDRFETIVLNGLTFDFWFKVSYVLKRDPKKDSGSKPGMTGIGDNR